MESLISGLGYQVIFGGPQLDARQACYVNGNISQWCTTRVPRRSQCARSNLYTAVALDDTQGKLKSSLLPTDSITYIHPIGCKGKNDTGGQMEGAR